MGNPCKISGLRDIFIICKIFPQNDLDRWRSCGIFIYFLVWDAVKIVSVRSGFDRRRQLME
jgi:hypothetical protein